MSKRVKIVGTLPAWQPFSPFQPLSASFSPQVFRTGLFSALIEVAASGLCTCKDFEVTNLLWACAQLCKHFAKVDRSKNSATLRRCLPVQVAQPLCALMKAVRVYFQGPILVSALVSIATLASLENLLKMSLTEIFRGICEASALNEELSFDNKTQVRVAGKITSKHKKTMCPRCEHVDLRDVPRTGCISDGLVRFIVSTGRSNCCLLLLDSL